MTGYGKAQGTVNGVNTTVEVRSVNGRYLELSVKLPKDWAEAEAGVRETVREMVTRGNVSVYIRRDDVAPTESVVVNLDAARAYVEALRTLQNELGLSGTVGIEHLTSYEPAFRGTLDTPSEVWSDLQPVMVSALHALSEMRTREGSELAADMITRLNNISESLTTIQQKTLERIPAERERLRERVRQLVSDAAVDEQRLQFEIVLLSEKLDVSEECVRLRSHLKHYVTDLHSGGAVGRKLNFLLQEMNREVNTIGSKANDAEIAILVVGMKEELERIREQVQNLE